MFFSAQVAAALEVGAEELGALAREQEETEAESTRQHPALESGTLL